MRSNVEEIARIVIDCGYRLHQNLGPGLLESAYEAILADQLVRRGLYVERQKPIPIWYDGLELAEGFRADLMIEGKLLVELKSVERLSPLNSKHVKTGTSTCRERECTYASIAGVAESSKKKNKK